MKESTHYVAQMSHFKSAISSQTQLSRITNMLAHIKKHQTKDVSSWYFIGKTKCKD